MKIALTKIVPNPFRDLALFPLDEEQIEKLVRSIDRHGFFGNIRARMMGSVCQIAMGHHRVEAARRKQLKEIDIDVRDMSDAEMIRLMTSENAIQAGSRAPAIMNEVNAAIGQLAQAVLSSDHLSQIRERWPEIAQCFQSQKGFETARGTLENGDGVGVPLIRSYLGDGGDPDNCPRSGHQIRDGLAALKSAGLYTKVITEVRDRIAAEAVEQERQAEEAEREAERTKTAAKSAAEKKKADAAADSAKKKKKSAGKASEARDRANRTSETTTKRQPQTYDPRCVNEFANAEQERAFREAVTTAAARRFIAVDQQLPLAKRMIKELRDRDEYRGRLSATTIQMYVSNHIQDAIRAQKQIDEQERQALLHQQYQEMFGERFKNFHWSLDSVKTNADKLLKFVAEHPEFAEHPKLGGLTPKIESVINILTGLKEKLHGQEVKAPNQKENAPRLVGSRKATEG